MSIFNVHIFGRNALMQEFGFHGCAPIRQFLGSSSNVHLNANMIRSQQLEAP